MDEHRKFLTGRKSFIGIIILVLTFLILGSTSLLIDTDGDGLRNYEEAGFLGPTEWDDADTDGDGISDRSEYKLKTDPTGQESEEVGNIVWQLNKPLSSDEVEWIHLLLDNPHNIRPQIISQAYHKDEDVTDGELMLSKDSDDDGLINGIEEKIGTDPRNRDTDGDGLLDGWEYTKVDGVVIDDPTAGKRYHPLEEASPVRKDLYLRQLPVDGTITKSYREKFRRMYATAPVSNPDGGRGITVHWEIKTSGLRKYERLDKAFNVLENNRYPLSETRLYILVNQADRVPQYSKQFILYPNDEMGRYTVSTLDHETMHGLVGSLDEEIQEEGDPLHPDREDHEYVYGNLSINNPIITEEINRDGMLHRDKLGNFSTWNEVHDWKLVYDSNSKPN